MNLRELKEIFRLVEKSDFSEVEIWQGDVRVRIGRGKGAGSATQAYMPVASPPAAAAVPVAPTATHRASATVDIERASAPKAETGKFVTSPFVGTFYRSPSPDAPSYVDVGAIVKKGQALCIVEAMKLMNEIESDYDGRVAEIYVENGKPVEFGEKLFRIESV